MSLLISILPLIIIFTCLFIFKLSSIMTGTITFIFISMFVTFKTGDFSLSFNGLLDGTFHAVLISSIVSYVIFFGVFLFHLMNESKIIKKISEEIKNLTDDYVLQVIILIIGISPLIESTSGFGTAFLVITPILISLGVENYKAALIGILSLLAVPWGALATGTKIGSELIGINIYHLGTLTAILSLPTITYFLIASIYILYGKDSVYKNKRKLILMPIVFSITNIVSNTFIDVELSGVISSMVTLFICIMYISMKQKRNFISFLQLLSPYILITCLILITRIVSPIDNLLKHSFVLEVSKFNFQLPIFYSPGFWLFISCLFTIFKFKISKQTIKVSFIKTTKQWGLFILSTTLFLSIAEIMDMAGMTKNISANMSYLFGSYYIFFSLLIGTLGGFLTGSNTGANAMFMKLQVQTSNSLHLPNLLIASIQNTSASNATMSTPSRITLATELYDIKAQENQLLKDILKILMGSIILLTITSYAVATLLHFFN